MADLSDPRFADEDGTKGMWAPFHFMFDVRPGVYFAAPYDPGKIPVYEDADGGWRRRLLPPHVRYGLVFAFRRKANRFGESADGVVTLASELRPEAQDEALLVHGIDETHRGVLDSPETAATLNAFLR